jgi:hypothetical protein
VPRASALEAIADVRLARASRGLRLLRASRRPHCEAVWLSAYVEDVQIEPPPGRSPARSPRSLTSANINAPAVEVRTHPEARCASELSCRLPPRRAAGHFASAIESVAALASPEGRGRWPMLVAPRPSRVQAHPCTGVPSHSLTQELRCTFDPDCAGCPPADSLCVILRIGRPEVQIL